ncbi:Hypothetical predicted protein [Cloeon dipterum]|uniref:K Homology domain-containing protein n=1 Tax=Cloeon dipterum TaxID=197152 RepID=A0A8S1D554_9INSE|nr:Hypothetical predicted protein [Cloeon dipterum]
MGCWKQSFLFFFFNRLFKEIGFSSEKDYENRVSIFKEEQAKAAQQGSPAPQTPLPIRDCKYVDIYREKPIRVIVKVLVPVREHPKFNFVGKLLGPKGNSMKRLQEETMTKMAVLGRGSMRDKQKEEELRASMDPKYCHLSEELHVEITAYAPPAEAHARIAYALAEVRKYLIPDSNDEIRQEQMREMELLQNTLGGGGDDSPGANGANSSSASSPSPVTSPPVSSVGPMPGRRMPLGMRGGRGGRGGLPPPPPILRGPMPGRGGRGSLLPPPLTGARGPHPMRKAPLPPPGANMLVRPSPKQKVMSILDRARVAMEESYQYEECYYNAYDPVGYGGYDEYDDNLGDYYEPADGYTGEWRCMLTSNRQHDLLLKIRAACDL